MTLDIYIPSGPAFRVRSSGFGNGHTEQWNRSGVILGYDIMSLLKTRLPENQKRTNLNAGELLRMERRTNNVGD